MKIQEKKKDIYILGYLFQKRALMVYQFMQTGSKILFIRNYNEKGRKTVEGMCPLFLHSTPPPPMSQCHDPVETKSVERQ